MEKIKFCLITIILLVILTNCKEAYETYGLNPEYRYDILTRNNTGFVFDPDKVPPIGSTADDLDKAYPMGPSVKWTYRQLLKKDIKNKTFIADRTIAYVDFRSEGFSKNTNMGQMSFSRAVESIDVTFFMNQNKIVYIWIHHMVKGDRNQWIPGTYEMGEVDENGWVTSLYPGYKKDVEIYWKARGDDNNMYSYALSRMIDSETWKKAADPPPGYKTFAQRFGFIPNYL